MDIEQYSEIQHANGFPFLFHSIISKEQQHSCTLYGISSPSPLNWSVSVDCSTNLSGDPFFIPGGIKIFGFGECLNLLTLRASFNDLSGPLPEDIYNISTFRDLSLAANGLSGELDHRVSNLLELRILSLYGNELTGTIPENIGRLNKLENLLLHINQLNGTIQLSLANCSSLKILNLRVNNLGGELTAYNFSSLVRLRTIDLGDNSFTGSLPSTLFSCKNLANIRLSNNSLQGGILPEIQAFESLSFLSLSRNNFTNVTQAIKILMGCQKLGALVLSKNFYGESLPKGNESSSGDDGFKEMRILALGGCGLRGELPRWVKKLGKLQATFQNRLSSITTLEKLDQSENDLSGEIPGSLKSLNFLSSFSVADNNLEGPVLTGGQFDTFTASSFEGNARFCGQILHLPCLNTTIATGDEPDSLTLGKGSKQKIFVSSIFGFSFAVSFVVSLYYFLGSFSTSCARLIDACCQVKRRRSSIYVVETIM
ncbi:hypothetical protein Leryth_001580 [Lithospermum erythrorhizon]|nr:hypothetical protein Leryth_001580 [Lithospermum erythrorhizon]